MPTNVIGPNLRLLRDAAQLSQKDLAAAAEISEAGYKKIESGDTSEPHYATLKSLARALDVKVEAFFRSIPELHSVRFRSKGKLKNRQQILLRIGRWLEGYNQLEQLLEQKESYTLHLHQPRPKGKKQRYRWAQEQAADARKQFGLDPDSPIQNIRGLLEHRGVKTYSFSLGNTGFFGLSVGVNDGGPAIAINTWERITVERWIFTAAHELGHLILHEDDYETEETDEPEAQEYEANIFASHFLMPSEIFQKEWKDSAGLPFIDRVLKIKRMFSVSYKTVLWRLAEENLMGPQAWSRFNTEYLIQYNKSLNEADEPEALSPQAFLASFPESVPGKEPFGLSKFDFMGNRLERMVRYALEDEKITWLHAAQLLECSLSELRQLAKDWSE